ncbi:histone deacetylase [Candidatus Bathyarchaeota archaeon]|nr:histone deacetylase [Candidatus Bathyarchaeota archaeon]
MRTAIIYSHKYLEHKTGNGHPESPQRLIATMRGIERSGLLKDKECMLVEPRSISLEDLLMIHIPEHVERIRSICNSGGGLIDDETPVSKESFNIAMLAAGGAIRAVQEVMDKEFDNAFAIVRPPGHHAGPNFSLGFCIFNNVALAAKYLNEKMGLKRVLIFDIDAHHGNGTQEIFYDTNNVLYISIHEDPTEFPKTGFIGEVGIDEGLGYTVNIPLPYRTGDAAYLMALKTIGLPIISQYKPQFILISAGFDGYYRDPVADLSLSAYIFPKIFHLLLDLAHKICDGRLVAILEGGYNLSFLKKVAPACIAKMTGTYFKVKDHRPPINLKSQKEAEKVVEIVKRVQSRYWSL